MKGIINIEFVVSLMVFLSTVSFVSIIIINNLPILRYEAISNDMKSRAYQLSNILFYNLSNEDSYVLDSGKIDALGDLCINYENFRNLFSENLIVDITSLDGTSLLSCKPPVETLIKPEFTIKRFSYHEYKHYQVIK